MTRADPNDALGPRCPGSPDAAGSRLARPAPTADRVPAAGARPRLDVPGDPDRRRTAARAVPPRARLRGAAGLVPARDPVGRRPGCRAQVARADPVVALRCRPVGGAPVGRADAHGRPRGGYRHPRLPERGWPATVAWALFDTLVFGALVLNLWEETAWGGFAQSRLMARHGLLVGALLTALPLPRSTCHCTSGPGGPGPRPASASPCSSGWLPSTATCSACTSSTPGAASSRSPCSTRAGTPRPGSTGSVGSGSRSWPSWSSPFSSPCTAGSGARSPAPRDARPRRPRRQSGQRPRRARGCPRRAPALIRGTPLNRGTH